MPTRTPSKPWIQGTEMSAPDDSFYVNDYPYVHPGQVDYVCLGTAGALVVVYVVLKMALPRRVLASLPSLVRRASTVLLVLLFFAVLEGVLWLTVQRQRAIEYRPDPVSMWRVRAPVRQDGSGQMPTNTLGLASREVAVQKAPGTLRILSLGDSRTMGGAGADPSRTYPMVLQDQLKRVAPKQQVEVIQGAISGYTSYQGLLLYKHLGRRLRPDIITVAFGYQDGMLDWAPDRRHISDSYALTVVRGLLYKSNLFLVLRKNVLDLKQYRLNRDRDTTPSFPRVSVRDFKQNMTTLIRIARQDHARVLFIEMPRNPHFKVKHLAQNPAYARALQQVMVHSAAVDVSYVDLRQFFRGRVPATGNPARAYARYFVDDCHMTRAGHLLVAEHLAALIKKQGLLTPAR